MPAFDLDAVVHQLAVEILAAEDVAVVGSCSARGVVLALLEQAIHLTARATGGGDDAFRVGLQELAVHPRLVVVAFEAGQAGQPEQVVHACGVLRQQRHVGVHLADVVVATRTGADQRDPLAVEPAAGGEVALHADDRLDAGGDRLLVEVVGTEDVAVVGHRQRRHAHGGGFLEEIFQPRRTVEHRVLGMHVQVDERLVVLTHPGRHARHTFRSPTAGSLAPSTDGAGPPLRPPTIARVNRPSGDPAAWLRRLERRAGLRAKAGLTRRLDPHGPQPAEAAPTVDLAGNDYLGLSRHPAVLAAASIALGDYGLGATGSRLVRGSTHAHAALEAALADLLHQPAALVYSSGYLANLGAIRGVVQPRTQILLDAHSHASLVDGCRLSGASTEVFPHADVEALRAALAGDAGRRPQLVVTESLFSVDGDLAPLAQMHAACRAAGAVLLVDDAHAVGVFGPEGAGAVVGAALADEPDVVVTATLSKALGAAGGVVAGPTSLIEHLVDTGRTFVYDTALPPAVAAGALAAVALLRAAEGGRATLHARAALLAERLRAAGLVVGEPAGGVISVVAPDADAAVAWTVACAARGVAVGCFRPPSTPDPKARLRLTINAGISASDFDRAVEVVVGCRP